MYNCLLCTLFYVVNYVKKVLKSDFFVVTAELLYCFITARRYICVSVVFAVDRCLPVRLSVCLSVTFVYCIQIAEDSVKLLSRPGSSIIIVFLAPNTGRPTQFQEEPFQRRR